MAKKVGSEGDGARIATQGAASAGEGHNLTPEAYLTAVKEITARRNVVKNANEDLKAVRKKWKANGVELGVLDAMVRMAEWSRGEVRDHFDTQRRYAEWLGLPIAPAAAAQGEFSGLDDMEIQRREAYAMGRTASRTGKPATPPEELAPDLHQPWLKGFNEEDEQSWADADAADTQEDAEPEEVLEPGEAEGAAVEAVAPEQPTWKGYSPDYTDWGTAQWRDFNRWFDAVPEDATVHISHAGVVAAFRARRDGLIDEGGNAVEPAPPEAAPAKGREEEGRRQARSPLDDPRA